MQIDDRERGRSPRTIHDKLDDARRRLRTRLGDAERIRSDGSLNPIMYRALAADLRDAADDAEFIANTLASALKALE